MRYSIPMLLIVFVWGMTSHVDAQPRQSSPEQRTEQLRDALDLSEEQVQKVLLIYTDMDNERKALMESNSDDRRSMRETLRTLSGNVDLKIEELLTDSQKEIYQRIKQERRERVREFRNR